MKLYDFVVYIKQNLVRESKSFAFSQFDNMSSFKENFRKLP